jgi:hypothetical protein
MRARRWRVPPIVFHRALRSCVEPCFPRHDAVDGVHSAGKWNRTVHDAIISSGSVLSQSGDKHLFKQLNLERILFVQVVPPEPNAL